MQEGGNIVVEESLNGSGGNTLRVSVTDDGVRHVLVSELASTPGGAEIVTRTAEYSGANAAALRAAIQADDSLIRLTEDSEDFVDLPVVVGPSLLIGATPAAQAAVGTLPLAAPALAIQAVATGENENDIPATQRSPTFRRRGPPYLENGTRSIAPVDGIPHRSLGNPGKLL